MARVRDGAPSAVDGYFVRSSATGASKFRVLSGPGDQCREPFRVYLRANPSSRAGSAPGASPPAEARFATVKGRWYVTRRPNGSCAVYLSAASVRFAESAAADSMSLAGRPGRLPDVLWHHRLRSAVRLRVAQALDCTMGTQAGTARALVLAERDAIPRELWDAFARSGTAHLLSISGFHVGVVAALLNGLLSLAGRPPRTRAAGTAAGVWAYVLLIGAPTSAMRAAWMTTAFVAGRLRRAPARTLGALGLPMLAISVLHPQEVSGAGFQLTVAGTAGIVILAKWLLAHWPCHRGHRWIAPPLAAGIGASVFTAPVLAWHFGQVPLLSLPSSILLTPLVAAAVPGVLASVAMDVLGVPGARVPGYGAEALLYVVTTAASALGGVEGATWYASRREAGLLIAGALAALAFGGVQWRNRPAVRATAPVAGACAALWLGQSAFALAGRGRIEIVAIDVGQGDAIGVRTPSGRWLLVDAGPTSGGADAGLTRVIPYLRTRGVRRLEAVILTHPDEDHAGGLSSVLAHVPTRVVLDPGFAAGQRGHMAGLDEARRAQVPWRRAQKGDSWTTDGVAFHVLSPGPPTAADRSPNDWSVVLRITYGEFDALLMGDADYRIEAELLDQGKVEVLKVGHHGSRTSTSAEFVEAVSPDYALISAGARNRYGHPHPQVLDRLEDAGARVLRTDCQGTVSVTGKKDGTVSAPNARHCAGGTT